MVATLEGFCSNRGGGNVQCLAPLSFSLEVWPPFAWKHTQNAHHPQKPENWLTSSLHLWGSDITMAREYRNSRLSLSMSLQRWQVTRVRSGGVSGWQKRAMSRILGFNIWWWAVSGVLGGKKVQCLHCCGAMSGAAGKQGGLPMQHTLTFMQ